MTAHFTPGERDGVSWPRPDFRAPRIVFALVGFACIAPAIIMALVVGLIDVRYAKQSNACSSTLDEVPGMDNHVFRPYGK